VTKVHLEVSRCSSKGIECILIGHAGHPEVEGTMGQYDRSTGGEIYLVESTEDVANLNVKNPDDLYYVSQTTLSMDDTSKVIEALRSRFPKIQGPKKNDICYATQNRQDAVKKLAQSVDMMLVVGSANSSNSNRLRELAEQQGVSAYLIDNAEAIDPVWFEGCKSIGLTAGASAPEILVETTLEFLKQQGVNVITEGLGREEDVTFALPRELRVTSNPVQ
jgi:4-hydroxy-3-methylbut-2-enyl diphosphate reductase